MYQDGEIIVRQGEPGDCMFVVQAGEVEIIQEKTPGQTVRLGVIGSGDFFGEMALLESEQRSATARARGKAQVLTLDKKTFLRRVHEDPSLAYRLLQTLSKRVRTLNEELQRLTCGAHRSPLPGPVPPALAEAAQPRPWLQAYQ